MRPRHVLAARDRARRAARGVVGLLVLGLFAGCTVNKTSVSTPDSRKQEYEHDARKAALVAEVDKQRSDTEAKQKAALAERTARDEQLIKDIEAARAELAAGFTAAKAADFAAKLGNAEGSAPARDGRLDLVALAREAATHLERAATDPPAHAMFGLLTALPPSPERDAAVLRACPKVRPAVPGEAVADFFAECLRAAADDTRKLQWPTAKADLAVYRKAEDERQKARAEAAELARTRAKTLAFAVLPLFAGGLCVGGDCASNGWAATVESGELKTRCRYGRCLTDGWTTQLPDGTEASTRCRFNTCDKDGWDTEVTGGMFMRTRCRGGSCFRTGWTLELPDGSRAETRCSGADCLRAGWQTRFPDGRTVDCRCEAGDCNIGGAVCK